MEQRPPISIGILDKPSSVSGRSIRSRATQGRLIDPVEYLLRQGSVSFCLLSIDDLMDGRGEADVIFASRPSSDRELECLERARRSGRKIVVDLADNHTINPLWSKLHVTSDLLHAILEVADIVTVTNTALANVYRPLKPQVSILRTGFDVAKYASSMIGPSPSTFVFTMCNGDHLKSDDFGEEFAQVIAEFLRNHPDAVFHYFGDDPFPHTQSDRIVTISGQSFLEHKTALAQGGYALSVMMMGNRENRDDDFLNGKSPVKYWEHGGFAIPGIFSNSTVYRQVVTPGVNGLLADNVAADWKSKLEFAYHSRTQLKRLGQTARRDVIENFSIASAAQDLHEIALEAVR